MQVWKEMAESPDADSVYVTLDQFVKNLDKLKDQLMDAEMLLVDQIEARFSLLYTGCSAYTTLCFCFFMHGQLDCWKVRVTRGVVLQNSMALSVYSFSSTEDPSVLRVLLDSRSSAVVSALVNSTS